MKSISIEDMRIADSLSDAYTTAKFLERQGISLENFNLGNVHDEIEEAVTDHNLPVTQVVNGEQIQGYLIR